MKSRHRWIKFMSAIVIIMFFLQVASCGTLLYPERRGQTHGRIDVGVAVLDGIGLLLFVIPGLIAFVVDFATGAIYLPGGKRAESITSGADNMLVIRVNPNDLSRQRIEEIVSKEIGYPVSLDQKNVQVFELDEKENIGTELSRVTKATRMVK